ncbi:MAG: glycosyltransferase [Betaproteobacteria bacterium]|nr:glycosyltransferase [Betaproteobacteria bacterium]
METPLTSNEIPHALQYAVQRHQAGRLAEAEAIYLRILDEEPAHAEALHLLGLISLQTGRHAYAVELIETANELSPGNAVILSNLGEAYNKTSRPDDARRCCEEAVKLKPNFPAAHNNLGNALQRLEQLDAADKSFRAAVSLDPSSPLSRVNLGLLCLLRGDYATGLELYESRLERTALHAGGDTRQMLDQLAGIPSWRGAPMQGKRLLLWTEQGLGDTLMMLRYLPQIRSLGVGRLTVCCEPALVRLVQTCKEVDEVIVDAYSCDWRERIDLQCPTMSLPLALGTRLDTIPGRTPYLKIPGEQRRRWSARVAALASPRIGLVWAGGKKTQADPRRSVSIASFEPLLEMRGISLISLQKDRDASPPQMPAPPGLIDWIDECTDLLETAALIEQLDLVISVDTAVAHLAGALDKPVWLLNRTGSEWRWMLGRDDSPWYPTMRIFNQRQRDWESVVDEIADAVEKEFRSAQQPLQARLSRLIHRFITGSR